MLFEFAFLLRAPFPRADSSDFQFETLDRVPRTLVSPLRCWEFIVIEYIYPMFLENLYILQIIATWVFLESTNSVQNGKQTSFQRNQGLVRS
jgi:hypothetical protein